MNSGTGTPLLLRADAHGQLVAEVSGERFSHSGKAHVLAQECGDFEVELVKSDDAVDVVFACEIGDSVQDLRGSEILRHGDEFGEGFARPVGVFELVDREQKHVHAEAGRLFEKRLTLFVGADAEDRRFLMRISHGGSCGR